MTDFSHKPTALFNDARTISDDSAEIVRRRQSSISCAFTLIELLVVVAIIAVLVAILLPSLSGARESAKLVSCMSNMKQIQLGIQMYRDENTDHVPYVNDSAYSPAGTWLPDTDYWCDWVGRLQKMNAVPDTRVFRCASDPHDRGLRVLGATNLTISYGINEYLSHHWPDWCPPITQLSEDVRKIIPVVSDACYAMTSGWVSGVNNWQARAANANLPYTPFAGLVADPALKRHTRGSVVLFADDHIAVVSQDELMDRSLVRYSDKYWW